MLFFRQPSWGVSTRGAPPLPWCVEDPFPQVSPLTIPDAASTILGCGVGGRGCSLVLLLLLAKGPRVSLGPGGRA